MNMVQITNKQIESGGIAIMMGTILALVTWQYFKGNIEDYILITIWASAAPFAIGLYVNSASPQKAQVLGALWGVFISFVQKKIDLPAALKELEVIIVNAVALWDSLNKAVKDKATGAPKA